MTTLADAEGYALHCDEYELTMAQSFLLHDQDGLAAFELTVRSLPRNRGYLVAAGLDTAVEYLLGLRFRDADLDHLERAGLYGRRFLDHLAGLRFTGALDAIPEGTPVGAGEPLLRVVAPRIQATLVESALLAIVNHQTLVATKAARVVDAAAGRTVVDYSLRRLHGPDAALGVARASFIGGAAGTASVVAGRRLGVPTFGTMAHHFVLTCGPDGEQGAFEQFLRDYPERATLLIDTYDSVRGARRAVAASRATGVPLAAVRIDSGDLATISRAVRAELDAAGMGETRIVASNELDEYVIAALVEGGAPIDGFGVGTALGTSSDAPALGGVYKLVAHTDPATGELRPVMKLSEGKHTDPGIHQVFRRAGLDVIGLDGEECEGRPLLVPVLRDGRLVSELPSLTAIREHCRVEVAALAAEVRRPDSPRPLPVERSAALTRLVEEMSAAQGVPPGRVA